MKLFAPLYAVLLLLLARRLPLWLDEVLTLIGSYKPDLDGLLAYIPTFAGGTPLTFLPPRWTAQVIGEGELSARLPSILASVAMIPAMWRLARRAGMQSPMVAVLVLVALPLQLRYALEARPYMLALALTVWATELFLAIVEEGRPRSRVLYIALIVLAVLAQPYAAFVAGAHLLWALFTHRSAAMTPILALSAASAFVVPWYAHYREAWSNVTGPQNIGSWQWRTSLVFFHEISGSGYAGAAMLLGGAGLGLRTLKERPTFWLALAVVPLSAVVAANAAVYYFFAIRQVIYVLPVLALLFAAGAERSGQWGKVLLGVFLAVSLYEDVNWFRKPREDWRAAAKSLQQESSKGACVRLLGDSTPVFTFFAPELSARTCPDDAERVAVGISPYDEARDYPPAAAALTNRGLTRKTTASFHGPRVEVFAK